MGLNIIYGIMKNRAEYVHPQALNDKLQEVHRKRIDKERAEKKSKISCKNNSVIIKY